MKLFYIFVIIIILSSAVPAHSQATYEVEINQIFKDYSTIILNNASDKYDVAIDYAVEIIKQSTTSLTTYYTLSLAKNIDMQNSKVKNKFAELKEKYFSTLDDFNSDQAEKLIVIFFIGMGIESNSDEEQIAAQKFAVEKLVQIKNTCQNNDYTSLAIMLLFLDKNKGLEYMKYFKEKFPAHSFIPLIDLDMIAENFEKKDYQKCIDDAKAWELKYKNIVSPYGWHITIECYNFITLCYVSLKDYENAKKYYELIKSEAPGYYGIKEIEKIMGYITTEDKRMKLK